MNGDNNFTDTLENLTPPVRAKTVEIANTMLEMVNYDAERAVDIGKRQALRWARENDIEIEADSGEAGDGGGDGSAPAPDAQVDHVHVIPRGEDWAVIRENAGQKPSRFGDKDEAVEAARAKVSDSPAVVLVHDERGRIEQILN